MFVLREGVTFHDGTPLLASDVKLTFERLVDPETASTSAAEPAAMERIEATDETHRSLGSSVPAMCRDRLSVRTGGLTLDKLDIMKSSHN